MTRDVGDHGDFSTLPPPTPSQIGVELRVVIPRPSQIGIDFSDFG
jgi:hypothetical protein